MTPAYGGLVYRHSGAGSQSGSGRLRRRADVLVSAGRHGTSLILSWRSCVVDTIRRRWLFHRPCQRCLRLRASPVPPGVQGAMKAPVFNNGNGDAGLVIVVAARRRRDDRRSARRRRTFCRDARRGAEARSEDRWWRTGTACCSRAAPAPLRWTLSAEPLRASNTLFLAE